jgi:hypothetical protein
LKSSWGEHFGPFNTSEILKGLSLGSEFASKSNEEIISYLREKKLSGSSVVKRSRLFLIGGGAAGKTTLVKRLTHGTFDGVRQMTDGIAMSKVSFDGVDFVVYDFAGQIEYVHTHRLFFGGGSKASAASVYLAVYRPDFEVEVQQRSLDEFLGMVYACAPDARIVLALTFADEDAVEQWQQQQRG